MCPKFICSVRTLKSHSLHHEQVKDIFRATYLAKLTYAAPAWWGFGFAQWSITAFINKVTKSGYSHNYVTYESLCNQVDLKLFRSITCNPGHILNSL